MDLEKIYSYIDANRDRYIELLQSFVRQPSVASMHPENEQMKELVMKTVREYTGAEPEEIKTPGNSVLYTEIPGKRKDRTLGIYNHYDVVSAGDESEWKYPPYSGTIEDGKILYSRGAADNKDALACRLCALEAIRAVGEELPLNIKMVYDGEEEVGSPSLSKVVADNPSKFHADGYMWEGGDRLPDNGPLIIALGAKGMLSVELFAKGGNIDIHSANAPLVVNPAWRLVWALASIKDANDKILIDGFYDDVEPVTQEELDSLKMGHFDPDDAKRLSGVKEYIGGVEGDEALIELFQVLFLSHQVLGVSEKFPAGGGELNALGVALKKLDGEFLLQLPDSVADVALMGVKMLGGLVDGAETGRCNKVGELLKGHVGSLLILRYIKNTWVVCNFSQWRVLAGAGILKGEVKVRWKFTRLP